LSYSGLFFGPKRSSSAHIYIMYLRDRLAQGGPVCRPRTRLTRDCRPRAGQIRGYFGLFGAGPFTLRDKAGSISHNLSGELRPAPLLQNDDYAAGWNADRMPPTGPSQSIYQARPSPLRVPSQSTPIGYQFDTIV